MRGLTALRLAASLIPIVLVPLEAGAAPRKASGAEPAPIAKSSAPSSPLDTAKVRALYVDGDFDIAIDQIETSLRTRSGFSREDSVFMFKHLGVMYAAKYETREKGKRYMLRLLEVEPTARILDMYASDMIYMIFKNIQDEFEASRRTLTRSDSTLGEGPEKGQKEKPASQAMTPDQNRKTNSSFVWVGATVAVAAAAAGTWYILAFEPKVESKIHRP